VETCLWVLVAVLATAMVVAGPASLAPVTSTVLALLSLAFGARSFVGHGGARITALGLFNFACAMFVGYSGLYWVTQPPGDVSQRYLVVSIFGCFAAQLATTRLAWRRAAKGWQPATRVRCATSEDANWVSGAGALVLLTALALRLTGAVGTDSVVVSGVAFAAVVLVAVGTTSSPHYRIVSVSSLWPCGGFAIYTAVFHTGNGRLQVVALACAIALLVSVRLGTSGLKYGLLASTPLTVAWLAWYRLDLIESTNPGGSANRTGLESMTSPLALLARLIETQWTTGEPLALGGTFVTAPLNLLPSWLAPAGPEALGYELVEFFAPEKTGTGYSMAVLTFGEWLYNFSFPGLVLMVPVMAWILIVLDRQWARVARRDGRDRRVLVTMAMVVVLVATVGDLVWGGMHTYLMRVLSRLPVLFLVLLVVVAGSRLAGTRPVRTADRGSRRR
jgi:hypothetical protein